MSDMTPADAVRALNEIDVSDMSDDRAQLEAALVLIQVVPIDVAVAYARLFSRLYWRRDRGLFSRLFQAVTGR